MTVDRGGRVGGGHVEAPEERGGVHLADDGRQVWREKSRRGGGGECATGEAGGGPPQPFIMMTRTPAYCALGTRWGRGISLGPIKKSEIRGGGYMNSYTGCARALGARRGGGGGGGGGGSYRRPAPSQMVQNDLLPRASHTPPNHAGGSTQTTATYRTLGLGHGRPVSATSRHECVVGARGSRPTPWAANETARYESAAQRRLRIPRGTGSHRASAQCRWPLSWVLHSPLPITAAGGAREGGRQESNSALARRHFGLAR